MGKLLPISRCPLRVRPCGCAPTTEWRPRNGHKEVQLNRKCGGPKTAAPDCTSPPWPSPTCSHVPPAFLATSACLELLPRVGSPPLQRDLHMVLWAALQQQVQPLSPHRPGQPRAADLRDVMLDRLGLAEMLEHPLGHQPFPHSANRGTRNRLAITCAVQTGPMLGKLAETRGISAMAPRSKQKHPQLTSRQVLGKTKQI